MLEGVSVNGTPGVSVAAAEGSGGGGGGAVGDGQGGVESTLGKIGERRVDVVAKLRKSERFKKQLVGTGLSLLRADRKVLVWCVVRAAA